MNANIDFYALREQMTFSKFFLEWPWVGLGFFISIMILAFATDFLKNDKTKNRWYDPVWLAWLGASAYMLHNIEEYGIAFNGMTNAFPYFMTGALGFQISEGAYLACNIGLVWICGPLAAVFARKHRGMAMCMSIFELINGVSHVAQAIMFKMYNPGLVSSIIVFIPLSIWTCYVCFGKKHENMSKKVFAGQFAFGFLYHAILIGGVAAARTGIIEDFEQTLIMIIDDLIAIGGWYWIAKKWEE